MSDIQDQGLEDETSEIQDGVGASTDAESPAIADSSDAIDDSKPEENVLSIVRDVTGAKKDEPAAASSATGEEAGEKPGEEEQPGPDDENYSDVPFNKHPRFQKLLSERNAFKTDADRYQNVQNFLDQQGLDAQETADLLIAGGLMKSNPVEAWKRIKPTIQNLLVAAGEAMPDDLRQRVQAGELTREAAIEISRAKAEAQSSQRQMSFGEQQAVRRQQQEQINAVMTAASGWEADRRVKDPNFEAKLPALRKEIVWLQSQEGVPTTPQGVQVQMKKAYDAVNAAIPAVKPSLARRQPVAPIRGGQVAGNARPEPNSILDIIRANRQT